jgi:glycosyltransferase involved in cell wall biosynthesis
MKISVALCTYNGARFLRKQLDSFLAQERLPDEIVVCDDGSTDDTIRILEKFQSEIVIPVALHCNSANLGPAKNFEKAIKLCSGDLIALSDQDDVWLPKKLALAEHHFQQFPKTEVVFSNGIVVDSDLAPRHYTLWEQVGFTPSECRKVSRHQGLEVLLKHVVATGATMVMKASIRDRALPIPALWMHDAWIAIIAAASGTLDVVPAPVFLYRQHAVNVVGAPRLSLFQRYREALDIERAAYYALELNRYRLLRERLLVFADADKDIRHAIGLIDLKLKHVALRSSLPNRRLRRITPILSELLKLGYFRYSASWQVAVKDFLLPENF